MMIFRTLFLFLSVQFFLYNMGLLTRRLSLFLSLVTLLLFVMLSLPGIKRGWRNIYLVPASSLFVTIIIIASGIHEFIFVFPLLLSSMILIPPRGDHRPGERKALLLGMFIYSVIVFTIQHVPAAWMAVQRWGLAFSKFSGSLIGQHYLFGKTASGVPVFLMFLSFHAGVAVISRQNAGWFLTGRVILMLILQIGILILMTPFAILVQYKLPLLEMLLFNPQVFILPAFLLTLIGIPLNEGSVDPAEKTGRLKFKPGLKAAVVMSVLALFCAMMITLRPDPGRRGGKVVIYDRGYLNFMVPVYGKYGHKSGGMFGYLPRLLSASGYRAVRADSLSPEVLQDADGLVVINLLEFFSEQEKRTVLDFVRRGGGLLALGDHTGVKGIRGPFNHLLRPYRIEFNFDSATFMTGGWGEEAVAFPHPVTHGLYDLSELNIWVGASLSIAGSAYPVVVGRYGYSDLGNMAAFDHAYLGNRIYDPGEQMGDIILIAANEYGRGKVMVFGDTSPFQNSAMVSSYRLVNRVFRWLTSGGSRRVAGTFILTAIAIILSVLIVLYRDILLAGVISISILAGTIIGYAPRRIEEVVSYDHPTAYVDASHAEMFDKLTWYDNCLGGMYYNLMRAGYFPLLARDFSRQQLMESSLALIVAPMQSFSVKEREIFDTYMRKGGWVLYSCGFEERGGSEKFLEEYGLKLLNCPLTAYPDSVMGERINVTEGWGIETGEDAEIIAGKFGYPYIVKKRVGNGGLILVSDTHFFKCRNLEGIDNYFPGNINFIRKLLGSITGPGRGSRFDKGKAGDRS